jgi:hypothetical protein
VKESHFHHTLCGVESGGRTHKVMGKFLVNKGRKLRNRGARLGFGMSCGSKPSMFGGENSCGSDDWQGDHKIHVDMGMAT